MPSGESNNCTFLYNSKIAVVISFLHSNLMLSAMIKFPDMLLAMHSEPIKWMPSAYSSITICFSDRSLTDQNLNERTSFANSLNSTNNANLSSS
jgi:hypothetical protein